MEKDIIELLLADHAAAKSMLESFPTGTTVTGREDAFCEVVQTLVAHEMAEEVVVYPVVREKVVGGDGVADERIEEQSKAEELLKEMESVGTESPEFDTLFGTLRSEVLEHAEAEEQSVFEPLRTATTSEERAEMGARYQKAKDAAPTHPHPHAPDTPPGNKVVGQLAGWADKARDAMRRAVA